MTLFALDLPLRPTFAAVALALLPAAPALAQDQPPADNAAADGQQSMAVFMLKQLKEREDRAYEQYERAITDSDVEQVKSELQSVVDGYDRLITESPNFAPAYVAYGLMLNRIGEDEASYAMLLKADELDPGVAVVKNQLGNRMAESGKYAEAYGFYLLAADLAPKEPLYQLQAGNLLAAYRTFFIDDKLFTPQEIDREIQARLRRATKYSDNEPTYVLRYAQSFFDIENPDWVKALEAWQEVMKTAKSEQERQLVWLYMARVRLEMGHFNAVKKLLEKVDHPDMQKTKQNLLEAAEAL